MSKFTDRDASIVTQASQKVAVELLKIELQHEAFKLPAKAADKLEALEARYDMIVKRLVSAALSPYVTGEVDIDLPAEQQEQQPPAAEPAKPAAKVTAPDTLQDEFDKIPY